MKKYLGITFLSLLLQNAIAQNETNFWYFGTSAGFDFTTGSPVPITGQCISNEGTAAASDPVTGNLLFYSEGSSAWDASHTVMPNGTGMLGNSSSTMAALAVPQPGNPGIYYLFTTDAVENNGVNGFKYNIIDMSLNGGMGDVTLKNQPLFAPSGEVNHAVIHANCTDYWIIARESGNNVFRTYLLTSTGISAPNIQNIGIPSNGPAWGQGKFSPDGSYFAVADGSTGSLQLFSFDNTTGMLSNPITLSSGPGYTYGLCFSPDNTKLYGAIGSSAETITQWDVSSGVAATIIASQTTIGTVNSFPQLGIGKDYKIYVSNVGATTISVINNPNATGLACNLTVNSINLAAGTSSYFGLPEFPENYFNTANPCTTTPSINAVGSDVSCFGDNDGTAWVVMSGIDDPYTVNWTPGNLSTDTITNLISGMYYVTVTDSSGTIFNDSVFINQPATLQTTVTLNPDSVCAGSPVNFTSATTGGTTPYSYQWSTSANDTLANFTATPSTGGNITLNVTDANGCTTNDNQTLVVLPAPDITAPADTCICAGESVTFTASGTPGYLWSTGATSASITVNPTVTTTYTVSYNNGICSDQDLVEVCILPTPVVTVFADTTTIELGVGQAQLGSTGTGTISWWPATGLSCDTCANPVATPEETTTYAVTYTNSNGCSATATIVITVDYTLLIPNVFSPNADGKNDTFFIEGLPPQSQVLIYNRWGNLLFENADYANNWSYDVDGVYYYVLTIRDGKTFTGFVHIVGSK